MNAGPGGSNAKLEALKKSRTQARFLRKNTQGRETARFSPDSSEIACDPALWLLSSRSVLQNQYKTEGFFDETIREGGEAREHYRAFLEQFESLSPAEFEQKRHAVDLSFLRQGVTFNVYGDSQGTERIFPFDLVPRIIPAAEWEHIEAGLVQRITALNLFLHDIYHQQRILKDGVIPPFYVLSGRHFRREFVNLHPHLRHRSDPRRGRPLHGARGQRALSVGRELCFGKPARDEACLPAHV
jgi:hypothetical protein